MTEHRVLNHKKVLINHAKNPIATLILSHGAGAPMDSLFMQVIAEELALANITTVRFEFDYMAKQRDGERKRPPPKIAVLVAELGEWLLGMEFDQFFKNPIYVGGKSMGGRIATLINSTAKSKGLYWSGVICLGYPFHPPQKTDTLRLEHLDQSVMPICIIQGTRDAMGSQQEVCKYTAHYPQKFKAVNICWIETADHDLKPLQKTKISHAQALKLAALHIQNFIQENTTLKT